MSMNVEIVGLNQMIADVKRAGGNAKPLVHAALQNSATLTQKNIREEAPIKTGALKRSIQYQVSYPSATVQTQEKYGPMVESGTRPHLIVPKNKKALFWKGALNPYRAVHHPGTKANPFFERGVDKSEKGIFDIFTGVIERLVREMAGR